ncbi:protein translocase subunit SecF [Patescibacteria group bacterium]|nr:protein translocase subunit SecF [Patescibacteria group bacterium]MBU1922212.1 protein translocase subunit SecF [Patescibacteria group bacterium]
MAIVKLRKIWFLISAALVIASVVFIALWGLNFGIDFTGGSLAEIKFIEQRPEIPAVRGALAEFELGDINIQPSGDQDIIFRFQFLDEEQKTKVLEKLTADFGQIEELRFDNVGPIIGQELRTKTIYAVIFVLLAIVVYVAWAFRKVSKPIASWKYGLLTLLASFHDVIIPIGVFSLLGKFMGTEINAPFIAAVLTILGYSVNDTIVVFDRVRENLLKTEGTFFEIVGRSIRQTFARSINTTLTTLLALIAIYLFGGETIKDFALVLIIGVAVGAYSSVFIASPLLVSWEGFRKRV